MVLLEGDFIGKRPVGAFACGFEGKAILFYGIFNIDIPPIEYLLV